MFELTLVLIQLLSSLALLPPVLATHHVLWLVTVALPALSITLIGNPCDPAIMKMALGKNMTHPKKQVAIPSYNISKRNNNHLWKKIVYLIIMMWYHMTKCDILHSAHSLCWAPVIFCTKNLDSHEVHNGSWHVFYVFQAIVEFVLYYCVSFLPTVLVCLACFGLNLVSFCDKIHKIHPTNTTCHVLFGQT